MTMFSPQHSCKQQQQFRCQKGMQWSVRLLPAARPGACGSGGSNKVAAASAANGAQQQLQALSANLGPASKPLCHSASASGAFQPKCQTAVAEQLRDASAVTHAVLQPSQPTSAAPAAPPETAAAADKDAPKVPAAPSLSDDQTQPGTSRTLDHRTSLCICFCCTEVACRHWQTTCHQAQQAANDPLHTLLIPAGPDMPPCSPM